jgi:hypothetical protein
VRYSDLPYKPNEVLEMLYHRELGYSLFDDDKTAWGFASAFKAKKFSVSDEQLRKYRSYFIEHGWAAFDGVDDPSVRLTELGQNAARVSIFRRRSIYSPERLRTYDWEIISASAAIIAAIFSIATFFGQS